jgi:hypothetical protein
MLRSAFASGSAAPPFPGPRRSRRFIVQTIPSPDIFHTFRFANVEAT